MIGSLGVVPRIASASLVLVIATGLALGPIAPAMAAVAPGAPPEAAPPPGAAPEAAPPPGAAPEAAPPPGAAPEAAPEAASPEAAPPPGDPADALAPPPSEPAPAPAPIIVPVPVPEQTGPVEEPPSKGLGMLISGGAITAFAGLPMTGYGIAIYAESQRNRGALFNGEVLGITVMAFGITGLAVGVTLLTVGAIKFSRYRAWQREHQVSLAPHFGTTALGTHTGGLRIRF